MTTRFDRSVSIILVVCIIAITGAVLYRVFGRGSTAPEPEPPQYVAGWEAIVAGATLVGDSAAPIKIIEFFDLQCPACREYQNELASVRKRFGSKVAFLFVHLPLPGHRYALAAARAADCAARQGRFAEFVDAVYGRQSSLGTVPMEDFAFRAGVPDISRFVRCTADTAAVPLVEAGMALARRFDVRATPTVMVNGWRYSATPRSDLIGQLIKQIERGHLQAPHAVGADSVLPQRRSRAGVVELFHDSDAFEEAPQLGLAAIPAVVAGGAGANPEFDLTGISHAALLSDGHLVALVGRDNRLLVFDSTGHPSLVIGRPGSGPGEFMRVMSMATMRDTIVLLDRGNDRVAWVSVPGGVLREAPLAGALPGRIEFLAGVLGDGLMIAADNGILKPTKADDVVRTTASLVAFRPGVPPVLLDSLPDLRVARVEKRYGGQPSYESMALRFSPAAHVAAGDSTIITGDGEACSFELRTSRGRVTSRIIWAAPLRPVTAAMRTAAVERDLQLLRGPKRELPVDEQEAFRLARVVPSSDWLPCYSRLFLTAGNQVWVLSALAPGDSAWSAARFALTGAITGRLTAPTRLGTPILLTDDRLVVRHEDSSGVVSLHVYPMRGLP